MSNFLNDKSQVTGEVYVITNSVNNKKYVGQTVSHRKNRGVYKPFGSEGRLKDHISEAICNTKRNQCSFLNNAIRKHGAEAFSVRVLCRCPLEELDAEERKNIELENTMFPEGYNLTPGGKTTEHLYYCDEFRVLRNTPRKRGGRTEPHRPETKALISERLKEAYSDASAREHRAGLTREQHKAARIAKFAPLAHLVAGDIESHIHTRRNKVDGALVFVSVTVGGLKTRFYPRPGDLETSIREQAVEFLHTLTQLRLQHDQIAGSP